MFTVEGECPAAKRLALRMNAQVILLQNERDGDSLPPAERLVNGSRGVVVDWKPVDNGDGTTTEYPIVKFRNGRVKFITPVEFEKSIYLLGTCVRRQVPLELAWALTIHKSQSLSIDYMIADLGGCFTDGQAYVAISRARSLDGLQIRKFSRDKIKTNETVRRFYSAVKEGSVDAFIRTLTLWWAPLVQHPKHILQGELDASTRAKLRLADAEAPVELTWKSGLV